MEQGTQKSERGSPSGTQQVGKLRQRQALFIQSFIIHGNATKAARAAGYSEKSAKTQGSRLLKNEHVAKELDRLKGQADEAALKRNEITEDFVLGGLKLYASGNIQDFLDEDGRPIANLKTLPRDVTEPIAEVTIKCWTEGKGEEKHTVTETKIRMEDRQRARELLGKKLKLWTDKTEFSMPTSLEELSDEQLKQLVERLRKSVADKGAGSIH